MLLLNVGSGSVVEFVWHILVNLLRLAQLDQKVLLIDLSLLHLIRKVLLQIYLVHTVFLPNLVQL